MLEGVFTTTTGVANAALSRQGTLIYVPGTLTGNAVPTRTLTWVTRQGTETPVSGQRAFSDLRFSPDGRQIATELVDAADDIWVLDLDRGSLSRRTFEQGEDETSTWSPDGRWLAYASTRGTERTVFRHRADGTGSEEALWTGRDHSHVDDWTSDGRALLVSVAATNGVKRLAPIP